VTPGVTTIRVDPNSRGLAGASETLGRFMRLLDQVNAEREFTARPECGAWCGWPSPTSARQENARLAIEPTSHDDDNGETLHAWNSADELGSCEIQVLDAFAVTPHRTTAGLKSPSDETRMAVSTGLRMLRSACR
jgi:hypothetical protein